VANFILGQSVGIDETNTFAWQTFFLGPSQGFDETNTFKSKFCI